MRFDWFGLFIGSLQNCARLVFPLRRKVSRCLRHGTAQVGKILAPDRGLTQQLVLDNNRIKLPAELMGNGIYIVKFMKDNSTIGNEKLIISR